MSPGTPSEVRAVAMTAPGKMEMRTYPYPQLDRDSAILKVEMTGVCGTDKHIFKGEASQIRGKSIFPYVGGHEVIGTIIEIGENAARTMDFDHQPLKVGDRVAIAVEVNCGTCWYCQHHYNNTTCENQVMAYGIHPNADTAPYLRGGFAEYMYIMPGTSLFKIPEDLPTDVAVFVEELPLRTIRWPGDAALRGRQRRLRAGRFSCHPRQRTFGVAARNHGGHSRRRPVHRDGSRRPQTRQSQGVVRRRDHQRLLHVRRGEDSASAGDHRKRRSGPRD